MNAVQRLRAAFPRLRDDLVYWRIPGSILMPRPLRRVWLARFGVEVHRSVSLAPRIRLMGPRLTIGARSFINYDVFIDTAAHVTLGEAVDVGMRAMFITSTHAIGGPDHRAGDTQNLPISVGSGTWIGAGAIILPGVSIGSGCIVAAGSVVTKDVEDGWLVGGSPARPIKRLNS